MKMKFWGTHFREVGKDDEGRDLISGEAFFSYDDPLHAYLDSGRRHMLFVEHHEREMTKFELAHWIEQMILENMGFENLADLEQARDFDSLQLIKDVVDEIMHNHNVEVDWTGNNPAVMTLD